MKGEIHPKTSPKAPAAAPTGVLLVNVGTPEAPEPQAVGRYLRQFLMDPFIIDIPWPARWFLVNALIVPRRKRASAEAYAKIWTPEGSPLLVHSLAHARGVAQALGEGYRVELGMVVGQPSVRAALSRLRDEGCARIVAVPLYPQHSFAAWDGAASVIRREHRRVFGVNAASPRLVPPFHADEGFLSAFQDRLSRTLSAFPAEHVLFSFHGLPLRQIQRSDPTGTCTGEQCSFARPPASPGCYRAQCVATARALAERAKLPPSRWSLSFQSRLGRAQWIGPDTESTLRGLAGRGVRTLAVVCPSFVADCLETLEEIQIRAAEVFHEAGGSELRLVPSLNGGRDFSEAVKNLVLQADSAST
ncbi:MAG: ferrochelatase [Bdellovibrionales bacterium]|nr:ferrochelatase [Bdellovibrionales bacterium]